jgi:hypothetical protein
MPKRFTDTGKWKRKWFRSLSPENKLFWHYLLDNCDHAGVWEVDFGLASYQLGVKLDEQETKKTFADKITVFDEGERWFINGFVEFQYGELKDNNHAHLSVIKILSKYGLNGFHQAHQAKEGQASSPKETLLGDKDKAKDKDKDMITAKDKNEVRRYPLPTQYCKKHDLTHWEAFCPKCVDALQRPRKE